MMSIIYPLFIIIWIACLISFGLCVFYQFKVTKNFKPGLKWYQHLALFKPNNFTEIGNQYRIKNIKTIFIFIILCLIGLLIGFIFFPHFR